jgi:multidrug efflux pump subunit AcrA (membrane-fusion protein)
LNGWHPRAPTTHGFAGPLSQLIGQTILGGATSFPAPIRASARFEYVQAQLTRTDTLARQSFESQQALNQAENDTASARADAAEAQANYDAAVAGPTREERAIAVAQVQAAAAAVVAIEHRFEKMILLAPADGVVRVHDKSGHSAEGAEMDDRQLPAPVPGYEPI